MSVAGNRVIGLEFSGDVVIPSMAYAAAENATSPGQIEIQDLSSGANTITPPSGAIALTIIPPAGNTVQLTLKGVTGDTGFPLHLTDPSSIALGTAFTTLCLTASATLTNLRFVWT